MFQSIKMHIYPQTLFSYVQCASTMHFACVQAVYLSIDTLLLCIGCIDAYTKGKKHNIYKYLKRHAHGVLSLPFRVDVIFLQDFQDPTPPFFLNILLSSLSLLSYKCNLTFIRQRGMMRRTKCQRNQTRDIIFDSFYIEARLWWKELSTPWNYEVSLC